jgi:proline iminopeptidase
MAACATTADTTPASRAEVVALDGARLSYRVYGSGPTVIVLPGGPGLDADYLEPVALSVAADGFRAVLPDLRGTGRSRPAPLDKLTVAGSVADLEALRQGLAVERVALVGHSFGGGLAQAYAAAHGAHVSRLVLLDSVGTELSPSPDPAVSNRWMARLTPDESARYAAARASGDMQAAIRLKFALSFADRACGDAFVARLPVDFVRPEVATSMSDDFKARYRIASPAFAAPVAIVYGEDDGIRAWQASLTRAYANSRVFLVPRIGHFPWVERPKETAQALHAALRFEPAPAAPR